MTEITIDTLKVLVELRLVYLFSKDVPARDV